MRLDKFIRLVTVLLLSVALAAPIVQAAELGNDDQASCSDMDLGRMSLDELKRYANDKYLADDCVAAKDAIDELIKRSHCDLRHLEHECLELFMNRAVCQLQLHELSEAKKLLLKLLKYSRSELADNNNGGMDEPDCLFFLAECDYRMGSYKEAEKFYRTALDDYRKLLDPLSTDLSPALAGLAGCLARKDQYDATIPLFEEQLRIDVKNSGADSLRTGWSILNLSDALRHLGKDNEAQPLFEKACYAFRTSNYERLVNDWQHDKTKQELSPELKERLRSYVFGQGDHPEYSSGGDYFRRLTADMQLTKMPMQRPFDFYNWRLKATRIVDAPGLVTVNPEKPLRSLIICVHGLGLHHGTYNRFAKEMSDRGIGVIAFDVRGFGSYKDNKGYDRVDLDACVKDLGNILALEHRDYPKVSLFLLGESMGGAIALRVASTNTKLIDGLVSSVPSGSRFGSTKTNLKVALRLLINRNKPFDIGKSVVLQATQKANLRQSWEEDPEARLKLSAVELLQFQKFMNQNYKAAERLKALPVVIFQGYGDKLVRPDGTLALYNAITSEDKDLIFVGHSEHLIFEEGQFKPSVINGLVGWLNGHLKGSPH